MELHDLAQAVLLPILVHTKEKDATLMHRWIAQNVGELSVILEVPLPVLLAIDIRKCACLHICTPKAIQLK